ncbi:MAG TPA: hypothetical protein PK955_09955, partial [Methanoregulaceae archaeon]|nr:hypothetical protein [Methanoregulaceae archaeon]
LHSGGNGGYHPHAVKNGTSHEDEEDCHSHSLLLLAMKRSAVELRETQRSSVHLLAGSTQKVQGISWRRNMTRRTKGKRTHRTCDCCGREIFSYQDTVYGDRRTYHYECWKPPITNDTRW